MGSYGFLCIPVGAYWVLIRFLLLSYVFLGVPVSSLGFLLGSYGLLCLPMGSHVDPLGYLMGSYGFLLGSYRDEATSHHTTRLSTRAVWGLRRCN